MKRHFYGLAIFASIFATAVLLHGFFNVPGIPGISAIDYSFDHPPDERNRLLKDLSTRVVTAEFDVRTGKLAADVELTWTGADPPPHRLAYSVFLSERSSTVPSTWATSSDLVIEPFSRARRVVRRVTFSPGLMGRFNSLDNLYMYVDAGEGDKAHVSHQERASRAAYVPVLRVHD